MVKQRKWVHGEKKFIIMETAYEFYLRSGHSSLRTEDLCVLCWYRKPKLFGLRGFEEKHLNFHTFMSMFYGDNGLFKMELFIKMPNGMVEITNNLIQCMQNKRSV